MVTLQSLTVIIHKVVKHGSIGVRRDLRQVQLELLRTSDELFQLGAVIQLEEGTNAPHDREDVEVLEMLSRHLAILLVVLQWDQTCQQLGGLRNKTAGSHENKQKWQTLNQLMLKMGKCSLPLKPNTWWPKNEMLDLVNTSSKHSINSHLKWEKVTLPSYLEMDISVCMHLAAKLQSGIMQNSKDQDTTFRLNSLIPL